MTNKLLHKIIDIEAKELLQKAELLSEPSSTDETAYILKEIYNHAMRLLASNK